MAILDTANTGANCKPEVTKVNIGTRGNPGILVSGRDLRDLEMLPARYYPAFKKYGNFAGNYGNAWWKQREEFEKFNGAILMTTNCIVPPPDSYKARMFTTGVAGYPGCTPIPAGPTAARDFSAVIAAAKARPAPTQIESGTITGDSPTTRRRPLFPPWWRRSRPGKSGSSWSWRAAPSTGTKNSTWGT